MPRHVFVIGPPRSPLAGFLREALWGDSDTVWHQSTWTRIGKPPTPPCHPDLIVAIAVPDPADAAHAFQWARRHAPSAAAFAILPGDCSSQVLREAASSFDDFVRWPVSPEEIRHRVERLLPPKTQLRDEPHAEASSLTKDIPLIGRDAAFISVLRKLTRVAPSDIPVLLTGETGTGKDLCARALHHLSKRRLRPFVPVDCGALPRTLFEREMFGHTRGAFTDAYREQRGLVAMADGGSLLLDEVDTLSMEAQAALLRVLEDGTYRPLGAERFSNVNVRIISASNVDLDRAVGEGRFRADLFFRLAGVRLHLPALRERRQDIRLLAEHLLRMHQHQKQETSTLSVDAMRSLECYPWPGNVRELSNVIRNAIMFSADPRIEPEDLELPLPAERTVPPTLRAARAQLVGQFERQYLDDLLRRCQGNLTHASRQAGQDRRALGRLVKKHALDPRAYHATPGR